MDPITITLNGEPHPVPHDHTLLHLLQTLNIQPETGGIAVAINLRVIPRSAWPDTTIAHGDDIEIIRATAGG